MSVFENEDELGYFTRQQKSKGRKVPTAMDLRVLTGLTMQEEADIEAAAINADAGEYDDAERCREYAGYGGLKDHDGRPSL